MTERRTKCPTCGSTDPYNYGYNCRKNADGWHRANYKREPVAEPSAPAQPTCPKCGQPLQKITYPSDSPLNRDQWESQIPGDLFCTCHNNHKGNKPYAYFWSHELVGELRPTPEPSESIEELMAILKQACDRTWTNETPSQIVRIAANAIYWRGASGATARAPQPTELIDAAEKLLEWCPQCSAGSSGHQRQIKLREAIRKAKGLGIGSVLVEGAALASPPQGQSLTMSDQELADSFTRIYGDGEASPMPPREQAIDSLKSDVPIHTCEDFRPGELP